MERMGHCGILDHEGQGGAFLRKLGLSPRVAKLVQCHVMAKRYLCYKDSEYYSKLSDASKVGNVGVIRSNSRGVGTGDGAANQVTSSYMEGLAFHPVYPDFACPQLMNTVRDERCC